MKGPGPHFLFVERLRTALRDLQDDPTTDEGRPRIAAVPGGAAGARVDLAEECIRRRWCAQEGRAIVPVVGGRWAWTSPDRDPLDGCPVENPPVVPDDVRGCWLATEALPERRDRWCEHQTHP